MIKSRFFDGCGAIATCGAIIRPFSGVEKMIDCRSQSTAAGSRSISLDNPGPARKVAPGRKNHMTV